MPTFDLGWLFWGRRSHTVPRWNVREPSSCECIPQCSGYQRSVNAARGKTTLILVDVDIAETLYLHVVHDVGKVKVARRHLGLRKHFSAGVHSSNLHTEVESFGSFTILLHFYLQ
ncbi:hypothetical protein L596_024498 [Steinernema carpocapsae]|uniref:Uncharacterized protein n=1 Tax=Steinernema carpocapsae TaxID=34508 RepID=A0A4U5MGY3_STECR|nr:hypothetical protein L596_024498 [Steinernema carpocapsae]